MEETEDPDELWATVERIILADRATKEEVPVSTTRSSCTALPETSATSRPSSTGTSVEASQGQQAVRLSVKFGV